MTGDHSDEIGRFEDDLGTLDQSLGASRAMVAAFEGEMRQMQASVAATGREVGTLSRGLSRGLKRSFEGLVVDGDRLGDVLGQLARSMADTAFRVAIDPVAKQVGGLLGSGVESLVGGVLPFGRGAAFSQGRVRPFADGGVVQGATMFPMRGGTGLMGEAGPEAIMPLARGADGRLGVEASGGGRPVTVVMNITTPDVDGFRRSRTQIAAGLGRALSRGQRNR